MIKMHTIEIKDMLKEGDTKSDGLANDVVKIVLNNVIYFQELFECLQNSDNKVRVHASDALEKVLRVNQNLIESKIDILIKLAKKEVFSFVKMHYTMIFAYIFDKEEYLDEILDILFAYLTDESAFVVSWTISTLTIIAVSKEDRKNNVISNIQKIQYNSSKAVQNRKQKALAILTKNTKIPKSWIKKV